MDKIEWRRFEESDWRAYAGAECFPDGSLPLIAEWELGGLLYVAVVGPERAMVEALDDEGEQRLHLVFENPLTLAALEEVAGADALRAMPGTYDLLS